MKSFKDFICCEKVNDKVMQDIFDYYSEKNLMKYLNTAEKYLNNELLIPCESQLNLLLHAFESLNKDFLADYPSSEKWLNNLIIK